MNSDKKRILIFTDWFVPGFKAGGPIRSIANLVDRIPVEFDIVTSVFDHQSTLPYPNITADTWTKFSDRVRVYYCSKEGANDQVFERIIRNENYHRIYFNSLFSFSFTLSPLRLCKSLGFAQKVVLAPRGMLKSSALAEKAFKKKIFIRMSKWMGLFDGITWHATNAVEEQEIKKYYGPKSTVLIAPNLSSSAHHEMVSKKKEVGKVTLLSIARISPEKGILEALQFLSNTDTQNHFEVFFYGVQQNQAFFDQCKKMGEQISNATIHWMGEVAPDQIPGLMMSAHFLYAPTRGENFGHAIAEALIHGLPVIVSDQTPWQDLNEKGAGWVLPLKSERFVEVLDACAQMTEESYQALTQSTLLKGQEVAGNEAAIQANYALFSIA